jgi:hypothetical protein
MLLYGCIKIDNNGPLAQYLKTFTKFTKTFKRAVSVSVALMQMSRREVGQGGGKGCGPEQLAATVPCALFTVDVSQWL